MINKISLMHKSSQDSNGNMFVEFHWEEILLDGERTCAYQDGSGYSGSFKAGYFHGIGTFTWPDGSRYEGHWENDQPHPLGTILLHDGYRY